MIVVGSIDIRKIRAALVKVRKNSLLADFIYKRTQGGKSNKGYTKPNSFRKREFLCLSAQKRTIL